MLSTPALSRYIELCMFQPFLRFYTALVNQEIQNMIVDRFQPFLRFYMVKKKIQIKKIDERFNPS